MILFPDITICIYALKGEFPGIRKHMESLTPDVIKMPSMAKVELLLGARKSSNPPHVICYSPPHEPVPVFFRRVSPR